MSEAEKKVPELRFEGFIDDWEQRKLGELCEEFQSGKNIKAEDIKENGPFPVFGGNGIRGYSDTYNHDGVYALVGRQGALCGNMNISYGKAYFTEHAIAVKANISNDTKFLFYLLGKMNLGQYSSQSAQPGLAVNKLTQLSAFVPNSYEQKQISDFLISLDSTIALHQRKLNLLKSLKQSYLQDMFPHKNGNSPTFRFSSFSNTWEVCKFKDFVSKSGKKNTEGHDFPAYSVSNKLGLVKQSDQFDGSRLDDLDKSDYKMVKPEEFAYNPARINVGSLSFNNLEDTVLVSSLYVVIKMSKKLDNQYVLQFLKSNRFLKEVKRNTEGSVREYLFFENFKNIKFPYTSNLEEQATLGSFFKKFDDTINLHQCKIERLLELKQILLRKMFI